MIGDFNFMTDNLLSGAFYMGIGYTWFGFLCKRLMMEEEWRPE